MSQFDWGAMDPNAKSGSQLAIDLNNFRDALNSLHRGISRPPYVQAGMLWLKEVASEQWDVVLHDGQADLVLRSLNPTTSELFKIPTDEVDGLDEALGATVQKDAATTTGAAILPGGTPAQRPSTAVNGMIRYNSTTGQFEGYLGGTWRSISSAPDDLGELWAYQPIGVPIPLFTHLTGVVEPPKDKSYRYVKLTAADDYNTGILTSESVSGSAPLVLATAVINLSGSPINGRTISLINTERRFIRAGSAGALEFDQMVAHSHIGRTATSSVGVAAGGVGIGSANNTNLQTGDAGTGNETRPKNIGATYYMRIK
ncbi:hypothetical protein [Pseudomonas putida]|uniref:Tail fiber protein n=1 Tax=Pseudomonas putida TaxID=303 RepID=A0A6S5U1D5_PSEPU|nr:hypothetical protein [Pseudomonas putida]BBT38853.1 hypothetical protein WP8W18C01_11940 [Pseudomonas putida]BBT41395.1 hypothetical protein WP8W18C01_37360 [Pseudomonas putida]